MLELIFQGFAEWAYELVLECWEYFSTALLDIMSMDYAYMKSHVPVMDRPNPTALRKAIKNPVEIANMKQAHLADGIALTRFMYWLKTQVGSQPITERSAAAQPPVPPAQF